MLQALRSVPFLAVADSLDQKVVRISGYKALLNKVNNDTGSGKRDYELQMPLQNTVVTLKVNDFKKDNSYILPAKFI